MLDRDAKELLIGWSVILIFAFALVYFQQLRERHFSGGLRRRSSLRHDFVWS
jgi:hypothetical protein